MIATFKPCKLHGKIDAPPSKSMAHRYLLGAALSGQKCTLSGVDYSEDVLASIDCLTALGAKRAALTGISFAPDKIGVYSYDSEKDKLVIGGEPTITVPLGMYHKYEKLAVDMAELEQLTLQQIRDEEAEEKERQKELKKAKKQKKY